MSSITNQRHDSHYENLWEIVKEFEKVMETDSTSINILGIRSESELGIPKKTIKRSLATLILLEENKSALSTLASAYLFLENFVDDRIYEYFLPKLKTVRKIKIQSGDIIRGPGCKTGCGGLGRFKGLGVSKPLSGHLTSN